MNTQSVVSEVRHVLQGYLAEFALQPIRITHVLQVFPLKVLRQVSQTGKGFNEILA